MTQEEIQTRLAEIKQEQKLHRNSLDGLAEQTNLLKQLLYTLETGLTIADKVKFMHGKVEKTGIITGWRNRWDDEIIPIVTLYKSNGELGSRKTDSYSRYKFEKI